LNLLVKTLKLVNEEKVVAFSRNKLMKVKIVEGISWTDYPAGQYFSGAPVPQSIPAQEIDLTLNFDCPSGVAVSNEEHCWTAYPNETLIHNVTCSNIQVMYAWYSMYNKLDIGSKILLGIHYVDRNNERLNYIKKIWATVIEIT
jgi:hypothetical protein